jgi:hypothetical protein
MSELHSRIAENVEQYNNALFITIFYFAGKDRPINEDMNISIFQR